MKILNVGTMLLWMVILLTGNMYAQEVPAFAADELAPAGNVWTPFPDKMRVDHLDSKSSDNPAELISSGTYALSAQSGIALEDMSNGTTQLIGPGTWGANSALAPIGFLFRFDSSYYTQFGVNGNGFIRLGQVTIATSFQNSIASSENTPKIMPFWDDLCVGNNGKVHYKKVGSGSNGKLVVEWQNMVITRGSGGCNVPGSGTFQMWLFDRTGVIQFVYGNGMISAGNNGGYSVGIQSYDPANFASITTFNSTVSYSTPNNGQSAAITVGTSFLLSPNVPAAVSGLNASPVTQTSVTLNWTDNATNENAYLVRRTTDNVNFYFVGNLQPNATSFTDTGLEPGTQYFYYVNALTEGAFGPDVSIAVTTNPAGTVSSVAAGGLWSSPATWAGGAIPTAGDNVTIPSGATVIIDTAAVARSVTVGSVGSREDMKSDAVPEGGAPAVLRFGETAAFSLTVAKDVTIGANDSFTTGAGNANQHVLTVSGNLTNNGTLDFSTNNNQAGAGIVFSGDSSNVFSGTGPVTDIRTITMEKGVSRNNILDVSLSNFTVQGSTTDTPASGYLFLNNGTFKISGTFSGSHRTLASPNYQITATAGLFLNNPNYTVTAQHAQTVAVYGLLRIAAGTFNVGTDPDDSLAFFQGSNIVIEGGNVNTAGAFRTQSNGSAPYSYSQTGGTITVCKVPSPGGCFTVAQVFGAGDVVTMTGGEVVIQNNGQFVFNGQNSLETTDATVRFGNAFSAQPSIFGVGGNLPNVVIDTTVGGHTVNFPSTGNPFTGIKAKTINIGPGGNLNTGGEMFTLTGEFLVNDGTLRADASESSIVFAGQNPVYSGTGTTVGAIRRVEVKSNSLTLDSTNNLRVINFALRTGDLVHANKLTLGNNNTLGCSVAIGTFSGVAGGTFDAAPVFDFGTGGQAVFYYGTGPDRTTGPEINPGRLLTALEFQNNLLPVRRLFIDGGDLTTVNLGLHSGEIATGSNKLIHIGPPSSLSRSSGYISGTLVYKFNFEGFNYTFHMGHDGYSGANIFVSSLGTNPSFVSVTLVDAPMPGLLPATSASRYWIIQQTGAMTGSLGFYYTADDIRGNEANYKLWHSNGGPPVPGPNPPNTNIHVITTPGGVTDFNGNWGIGEQVDPGPVSISGRVTTSSGNPIRNASVKISGGNLPAPVTVFTGSLGTYSFSGLQAGEVYTVQVSAKRYRFTPATQQVTPFANVASVDFAANPQEEF